MQKLVPVHHKPTIKHAKRPTEYATFPSSGGTLKNDKSKSNTFSPIKTYRDVSDNSSKNNIPCLTHEHIKISFDIPFNIDADFTCTPKVLSLAGKMCTCNYTDGIKFSHN